MRRPPTHAAEGFAEQSTPTAGHARFIGRVGALAVFLGVGAAIAMPAAHADTESTSSSGTSTSGTASPGTDRGSGDGSDTSSSGLAGNSETSTDPSSASDSPGETSDDDAATLTGASDGDDSDRKRSRATETGPDADESDIATADSPLQSGESGAPSEVVAAEDRTNTVTAAVASASVVEVPAGALPLPDTEDRHIPVLPATTGTAAPQASVDIDDTAMSNQVSPLGTPEQIDRERIAMRTAKSLPVELMKLILRCGFLAAAEKQFALVGGPDEANRAALTDAVDEYALAAGFQQQILNPMDPAVVTQVAPPHSWYGLDVDGSRLLYDNPDTIYRFIPVNKTAEYVLTGRIYEGIPADTTFSVLEGLAGTTSTILSLQDLDVSEDGTFVITVSGQPALPGQRNHLQLTSHSTLIAARNTLGDWDIEEPMELAVHRVGGPPNSLFAQFGGFVFLGSLVNNSPFLTSLMSLIPPLGIAETPLVRGPLAALILLVRGANEQAKYMALATTDPETGEPREPNVMTEPASNAEFLANQLQSNGYFQLADDEALVLTIHPGNSGFFTVPVYNDWTITDDYWNEQTSLNNDQAVPNADGTYTMVVSVADPLVANWVSTGGLNQGIISMRFQNLDPDSEDLPRVESVLVKLEDLDDHLPADTIYLTPEERTAQLAARKAGFDKRWAPYLQA
ncbi:MAG: DUF1214 domain-containing protein [Mycobacterium sp.]|nr:DUF1214 domain-containing protein [Mycobacterium sp.]